MSKLLAEKAMLASLNISRMSTRKFDAAVSREVAEMHQVSQDVGRYNKVIVAKNWTKEIDSTVTRGRQLHYEWTLPWYDDGRRMLPSKRYTKYAQEQGKLKEKFFRLAEGLRSNWPEVLKVEEQRLGPLFNPEDYPDIDEIMEKFDYSVKISPLPVADDFRADIQGEEVERIRKEIEARTQAGVAVAMQDLWRRIYDPVKKMAETLKDPEKVFHGTLVTNIMEVCELLPDLNITDDPALESLRIKVEEALCTWTAEDLRKDKDLREMTADEADEILKTMEGYV